MKAVFFVAGKSGGHIIPALTLAERMRAKDPAVRITFFSSRSPLDAKILHKISFIEHKTLAFDAVPAWYWLPVALLRVVHSFCVSLFLLLVRRPQQVVTTGGALALPMALAAWVMRVPVVVYELNVVPGSAVRFLSRFAHTVYICFTATKAHLPQAEIAEYPVRFSGEQSRARAREELLIPADAEVLAVLGGSQGSQALNHFVAQYARTRAHDTCLFILHQSGEQERTWLVAAYAACGIKAYVVAYTQDVALWYAAADRVLARAGAGTLFELLFFKKKSIIVPLEVASTSHQLDNACAMSTEYPELFRVVRQKDIERDPALMFAALRGPV